MSDATKQALEQFVTKMLAAAEQGASWTADQAPLLVQEWLRWQLASSLALGIATLVLGLACVVVTWKLCVHKYWDDLVPLQAIPAIVAFALLGASGHHVLLAIKVYVAPRVVVLEKFAELIK